MQVQSIRCNICGSFVDFVPSVKTAWTGDFWSKGISLKLRKKRKTFYEGWEIFLCLNFVVVAVFLGLAFDEPKLS